MAVKDTPIGYKQYYNNIINSSKIEKDDIIKTIEALKSDSKVLKEELIEEIDVYKTKYGIDLLKYNEFVDNIYIDGKFYKIAEGAFINKKEDYTITSELYKLFTLANNQKEIYKQNRRLDKLNKILGLKLKDYTEILRSFYTEVHKRLIIEGAGYAFGYNIGWICVNRCKLYKPKKHIDYNETKKREAKLIAEGKRIWNKDEAEYCKLHGIPYEAEDKRVYKTNEYCYEIPLIMCTLKDRSKLKFFITPYRHKSVKTKSYNELKELTDNNIENICKLPLDLKTKLTLCLEVDSLLYAKFIRNEDQKPVIDSKINSKNRQRF